jgi:type IV pilus assembly protein PilB
MGVNPDMLASALTLVESQRLVRRLCPRCRVERRAGPVEQELFRRHSMPSPETHWVPSPQGCPHCRRGYKGRVAAVEVLPVVDEVVRLVEQRARSRAFEEWMAAEGLPNVFQAALQLVAEGASSLEEALEWQSVWGDFDWRKPS